MRMHRFRPEAKFEGSECKYGHTERYGSTGQCVKCTQMRGLDRRAMSNASRRNGLLGVAMGGKSGPRPVPPLTDFRGE